MKKLAFVAALLAGALLAPQAHAQARGTGGYLGAGVIKTWSDNATDFAWLYVTGGSADSTATGFKAYGGYTWPSRLGIEVGYYDLGTYDVYTFGAKSDEFRTTALAFSGTYSMPLNPSADLTMKLGLAFTDAAYRCFSGCGWPFVNSSYSDIASLLGIGVGWRVAPNFSLRFEYEYLGAVTHSVGGMLGDYGYSIVSAAGQFHF
jgi:opacity protein-like surface antigen